MDKRLFFIFICGLLNTLLYAQQEETLDEVLLIVDTALRDYSETQNVVYFNDSTKQKSSASLTSLLNFNTPIYFKENGLGMVSSPAFRGTTASQTAVVWNGININSLSTGQTDFNTVATQSYDQIAVRAGGGSVAYGSSAIGGSVHLNNDLKFNNKTSHRVFANYGSFITYGVDYQAKIATHTTALAVGVTRNASDNDYPFYNSDLRNSNGQYFNNNLNVAFGYQLNENNVLKFYGNIFDGERHFSLPSPNATKTKYRDFNTRNMLEWISVFDRFTSSLKAAYLTEEYKYFPFIENEHHTGGSFDSKILKYELGYRVHNGLRFQAFLDYTQSQGSGSDIQPDTRRIGAASLLMKHDVSDLFYYELSARQELTDVYSSPFLYAFGTRFQFTDFYSVTTNVSKNFRIPTFSDMYWQGSGNPHLLPETSYQAEITNAFRFKNTTVQLTAFYNDIKDMIRWIPVSGSLWQPENTDRVAAYGAEASLQTEKKWGSHVLSLSVNYAYTVSKNKETEKQLIYVPYHKATAALAYSHKKITAYYQYLFTGEVYTTSDNNPSQQLSSYGLANLGVEYDFFKWTTLGFQVLNIWDTPYQSVLNRPMPGRNFNFYINLNF